MGTREGRLVTTGSAVSLTEGSLGEVVPTQNPTGSPTLMVNVSAKPGVTEDQVPSRETYLHWEDTEVGKIVWNCTEMVW